MKKITYSFLFSILLFGCTSDSFIKDTDMSDITVENEAIAFGKQMAENLRIVVTKMNKNGDDFNDLAKIKEAVISYHPQIATSKIVSIEELDMSIRRKLPLTPIQQIYMEKINEAQAKSHTANEFMLHLKQIIKEIQTTVPEIQQRNLLKTTVALYYITKEIDSLLKEGLMPVKLDQPQLIRLKSGNESDGYWAALWAGICVVAGNIGSTMLEILETLASAAGATLIVVAGCLLLTADTEQGYAYCQKRFSTCTSTIPNGCSICLQFCLVQGYWPPYSTHKCN